MPALILLAGLGLSLPESASAEMTCTTVGKERHCETEGNLAATQDRGCIALGDADGTLSPADLALSVKACSHEGRFGDAAELAVLLLLRGRFDTMRVSDQTAHQAVTALIMELLGSLPQHESQALDRAITALTADHGTAAYADFCARLADLEVPAHDPTYMIAHGMGAMLSQQEPPIRADFDAASVWENLLYVISECPR